MKKIGLALGGGGARGLCHIQFLKALDALCVKPAVIAGTSMGAIIGAFYAAGVSGIDLDAINQEIDLIDFSRMLDFSILSPKGLVKGKAVMDFIEKKLPVKTFEACGIPLKIVATDFWSRSEIIYDRGLLRPAIRASMSIPGVFEPVIERNTVLIDGQMVNPVPMSLIREECDILIAIDVSGTFSPSKPGAKPGIFDSIMNAFRIMETRIVEHEKEKYKPEIYIRPALNNIYTLDFHKEEEIMSSVASDVEQFKKELSDLIFKNPIKKKRRFSLF